MIKEKEEKEQNELDKRHFKAKEVPKHVKDKLYEKILKDNENRRKEIKATSVALTIQQEKPFSFYQRDLEKFKAKRKNEQ